MIKGKLFVGGGTFLFESFPKNAVINDLEN